MADTVLELRAVSKRYGDILAVDGICLAVKRGEFLTLLGPSGCGKTTVLRLLAGFETPSAGEILLEGRSMTGVPPERRAINTVFQSYALFPHMNVFDNVAFGLRMRGVGAREIRRRVEEALQLVHMEEFAARMVDRLSGGQQQRVAIARAVVNKPVVLLLDEPLSALDYRLRRRMQLELKHLQRSLGITFILVTHDQEEAFSMSDRVAVMNQGRVEQLDTPTAVYENPANLFVARFVGEINVLPAEVVACSGEVTQVRVEGRIISLRTPQPTWTVGDEVHVLLRPEDLRVETVRDLNEDPELRESFGRVPAFLGVVEETVYKGATYDVVLRLDSGTVLTATEFFNEDDETVYFRAGDRVAVTWVQGWETVLPHAS
ncbi:MAG: putrescine/spermidine transporter ATP-binding protein [Desulfomicrobiaceae bacterium]|nr:putrescine/spermidine transporter ATP-binding protein [Desulfomicrobiaceae bacterium]MBZ4685124.1 putrescine/spermidine transporter ATP-binding protein [Desulfomicrobiaceae bacterium]MDI3492336.1 spermidine/putrescine transport system ATP-binding protein [Desulfomicrobiaceae bacterium]MDK2872337.1 spermidine/putrescine transport system ATP-binding protein [Desulfomicrobiaceae bacterium]